MGLFDDIASKVKDALQEVTVQHILVDTESQAVSIRKEMAKVAGRAPVSPVLFGEYAARYSTCGSANKKPDAKMVQLRGLPGEMKFRRGQTDKAFEKACFEGSPGALQGPIKTQFGYHLVRIGGAKESGAAQGAGSAQTADSSTVEGKQEQSKNALKKQARAKGKRGK